MQKLKKMGLEQTLPWILVIGGTLGLIAAFVLTMDKMSLLQNPSYQPNCNLNPVLSCGSVIRTDQAAAFGFPNPFIGLAGFASVITIGMGIFAGAKYKKWFWIGLNLGALFGITFMHWLAYESIFTIGALCIYCMLVWSVTWPIFWYTTLYNLREKNIPTPSSLKKVVTFAQKHHADILVSWYILVLAVILQHFWYYWSTLL